MQDSGAFPQTACSLVQAGEHSGHMEDMTELLASYYERLCDERSQLRNMMIYPTFLFVCINILFFGALVFVIPVFSDLFAETGVPLPQSTRMLLAAGNFLCRYGLFLIGAAVMTGILIYKLLQRRRYRERLEELLWRIGRIRTFFLIWSWQRFSMILAVQLAEAFRSFRHSEMPFRLFRQKCSRGILCVRFVVWRTACLSVPPSSREDSGHLTSRLCCASASPRESMIAFSGPFPLITGSGSEKRVQPFARLPSRLCWFSRES